MRQPACYKSESAQGEAEAAENVVADAESQILDEEKPGESNHDETADAQGPEEAVVRVSGGPELLFHRGKRGIHDALG